MIQSNWLLIFGALVHRVPIVSTKGDNTDPAFWGLKDSGDDSSLARKTASLRQQALQILTLRGVEGLDKTKITKSEAKWDDIQMTDDLYANLKSTFDEEQKKYEELNSTGNSVRLTAPDFALIPFAKWTTMPIKFSVSLVRNPKLKTMVRDALKEIQSKTGCITFAEVDDRPSVSYILYREKSNMGPGVCADSPLGRQPDVNVINVASTCLISGTLMHETMHSLGFAHSQQRPDINRFVDIQWNNIVPEAASNFKAWKYALKDQGPFDYGSIMMYPRKAFALNPNKDTLIPKVDPSKNADLMGQRSRLSDEDVRILKRIYGCGGSEAGGVEPKGVKTPTGVKGAIVDAPSPKGCKDNFIFTCSYWHKRKYCEPSSMLSSFVRENCASTCKVC